MKACIQWLLSLPILRSTVSSITVNSDYTVPFSTPVFNHACSAPLTALLLDTDFLLENKANADDIVLKRIQASVQRLQYLMNSLTSIQDEVFNVLDVIHGCSILFSGRAHITVDIDRTVSSETLCKGSKILFSEVIVCLLSNAIESYDTDQKKIVTIRVQARAEEIVIGIEDQGCGMNMFEQWCSSFEGVSCKKKSTGIGLPFSIKTIKSYFSGSLTLKSIKSVGTTVSILLPLYSVHSM